MKHLGTFRYQDNASNMQFPKFFISGNSRKLEEPNPNPNPNPDPTVALFDMLYLIFSKWYLKLCLWQLISGQKSHFNKHIFKHIFWQILMYAPFNS